MGYTGFPLPRERPVNTPLPTGIVLRAVALRVSCGWRKRTSRVWFCGDGKQQGVDLLLIVGSKPAGWFRGAGVAGAFCTAGNREIAVRLGVDQEPAIHDYLRADWRQRK